MKRLLALLLLACEPAVEVPALDPPAPVSEETRLHVAGDEAAVPLFRHLADHFTARHPGPAVVVEPPLGATGARLAVEDGALDAALVVVPFAETARAGTPLAVTHATLATGAASPGRRLPPSALRALLEGTSPPALAARTFLLVSPDDPAQSLLATAEPALGPAFERALAERRWPVVYGAASLRDALRRTPGALAVTDTGSLRLLGVPLWPVRLEPAPGFDDRLVIGLVTPPDARPRLAELVAFLRGPEGQSLITDLGYELP